jgi:hypothetical protein
MAPTFLEREDLSGQENLPVVALTLSESFPGLTEETYYGHKLHIFIAGDRSLGCNNVILRTGR